MLTPDAYADRTLISTERSLLRFLACGSVDDGKSTLIGRLLHDAKLIPEDQFAAPLRDSQKYGTTADDVDFALLLDVPASVTMSSTAARTRDGMMGARC
jgi:hypothetical protein